MECIHGGEWFNKYSPECIISVDMVTCYPKGFLGYGECAEYFERFGDPTHEMTRVAINRPPPDFDLTGFVRVVSFEFAE